MTDNNQVLDKSSVENDNSSISDIRNDFLEIYKKRLNTLNKVQKLTEGGENSIIRRVFLSFLEFTDQTNETEFNITDDNFKNWKEKNNLNELKISVHTFKRFEKKLFIFPELHDYASKGMINNRNQIEFWEKIIKAIKENRTSSLNDNSMELVDTSSSNDNSIDEENNIFIEFKQILSKRRSNFRNKIQILTTPKTGDNPDSCIIFKIIKSFKIYTKQHHEKKFDIDPDKFKKWKEKFGFLNLHKRTFRKVYKKLYLYPTLRKLASRGLVDTTRHIESWKKIEKHLPKNLDSIETVENLHDIINKI